MSRATVVVPTAGVHDGLPRLLGSLAGQTVDHETIVVDNTGRAAERCVGFEGVSVLRPDGDAGFSRAVNLAARRAAGEVLVLVNDDCECDPSFVAELVAGLDPAGGVVMAAGVLLEAGDPQTIDTAGIELDRTLLAFDYLNGAPTSVLGGDVRAPFGPSGAAAAFDRETFLAIGGFDEALFAYWEDVDLALRLRRDGASCALAPAGRATHRHSSTLGSGSARKNYLTGFGRGYMLRKWSVLTPRHAASILARDGLLCLSQAVVDRNLAGVRGRLRGYRAGDETEEYPADLLAGAHGPGLVTEVMRRASRRRRLAGR